MVNLKSFEECRKSIFLRASRTDKLDRCPGVEIAEGIRATAYVHIGWPFDFDITKDVLDFWDITFEELLPIARANMLREFSICSAAELILSGIEKTHGPLSPDELAYTKFALLAIPESYFKVLYCGTYGTGLLAVPDVLKSAMPEKGDYLIFPLSMGLILVPPSVMLKLPLENIMKVVVSFYSKYSEEQEDMFFYNDGKLSLVKN